MLTYKNFYFIITYMLTVRFIPEGEELDGICAELGLEEEPYGSNFIMFDEQTPVALWRMTVCIEDEPVGVIRQIYFKDGVDEDDRVFFLHVMMYKLRDGSPIKLRYSGDIERMKRFGFEDRGEYMEIYSGDINLYYNCGGKH